MEATLERGDTSIALPLVEEGGGSPLVAVDIGKPELDVHSSGVLDPRTMDQWSGLEQYTLFVKFYDSNAYDDAIVLADLLKSYSGGDPLLLNIPMSEFDSDIEVAPAAGQDEATSMTYPPGIRDYVEIDLSLTRVSNTFGEGTQDASTPTATGSGPIELADGSTTVELSTGVEVSRSVGRPNSSTRRSTKQLPTYRDKRKAAHDAFELSFEFVDGAVSDVTAIADLFRTKLGRDSLTLDFNGLYGLGSFAVVPDGSNALRHTRSSGEQGVTLVPSVNLRRVHEESA
ncbi:hypothetical protein [Halorarum salinum]|uniref:Uncharacterized protein n=1 Tax=Halorarum salinum TaxID=2743089 RepID=A0A7D5QAT0_9EURY|nr:hypothetical protein [Halobaculum salinum]QLG62836.1 hypothetical protein HUG12_14305 [Halobaculum salinum]